jgi:hypothetical protein
MTPTLRLPDIAETETTRVHRHEVACHLAGEGDATQRARIDAALQQDARVQAWRDELVAEDRAAQIAVPLQRIMPQAVDTTPWWQTGITKWAVAMTGVAGLAAVLMMPRGINDSSTRTKGGAQLAFVVQHEGGARPGVDGESLHAGARIQLLLRANEEQRVVVVGIDGQGGVDVYFEAELSQWPRNALQPLPNSLVLDDAVGDERVVAVFGDQPAEVLRAAAMKAAAAAQPGALLDLPPGMHQQQVRFHKPGADVAEPAPS